MLSGVVIGRLACFQFGMVVCGFWAYFLYASDDWLLTITILLGCWICSCLIDLLVLVLSRLLGICFRRPLWDMDLFSFNMEPFYCWLCLWAIL